MQNYKCRIPLKGGKWAYEQLDELAQAAKEHIQIIRTRWTPPKHFFHLQKGGHVAALRTHQNHAWFGKIDLSRFFNNVTRNRITKRLKSIGYSFLEADEFAVASTVCVDHETNRFALPYGFVQSPLLASLDLDKSALGSCLHSIDQNGPTLSVYVDDIIVSHDNRERVQDAIAKLHSASDIAHFPINTIKSGGPEESIRAFNIDLRNGEMLIATDRFQMMEAEISQFGISPQSNGILNYVKSVNDIQAIELINKYPSIFPSHQV